VLNFLLGEKKQAGRLTFFSLLNKYLKHHKTQIRYLYFTDVLSYCNTWTCFMLNKTQFSADFLKNYHINRFAASAKAVRH
jgi:hypothetical protein